MPATVSSTTSSKISTSSSTSDGLLARVAAVIRLVHPFPSLLDGAVVAAVALVAGADVVGAFVLGASMTALQGSIGALNDLHDAPADAGHKPGKPIPAGMVSVPAAWSVVIAGAAIGVALALVVDLRLAAMAVVVLLVGYGYDLAAKGTAWSWLPFALGIPLLPVYGWLGAVGSVPSFFIALTPMATTAGAALAIANARADLERDLASGTASVATELGSEVAWRFHAVLWFVTLVVGLGWLANRGVAPVAMVPVVAAAGLVAATVVWSREARPSGRERAWQIESVGGAVALLAWLAAVLR